MKWWQFKNQIKKELKPVYVFIGKSEKLKETGLKLISERFSNEIIKFNYENSPSEILNELNSNSLFSKKKIVLVKEGEKFKKNDLKQILEFHKSSDVILVIFCDWKREIVDIFNQKDIEKVDCFEPFADEIRRFIFEKTFSLGKKIDEDATSLLISISNGSLSEVEKNLDKILLFCGDEKSINTDMILSLSTSSYEENVFDFVEKFIKNPKQSVSKIPHIEKKEYFNYLGMLRKQIESALILKGFSQEKQVYKGLEKLRLKEKKAQPLIRFAERNSFEKLEESFKIINLGFFRIMQGNENAFSETIFKLSDILD